MDSRDRGNLIAVAGLLEPCILPQSAARAIILRDTPVS